ncbi:MAG: HAD hydrolase family protein [Phycisphaerales bacterium]|nr:HAD hydrolase family protein [Phycisphaerales bacterium]
MPPRRYDLIAIDLDGTLLNSSSQVTQANALAIRTAREAGAKVIVCTGRGLVECRQYLDAIGQTDPVVVAGGSIIACPVTSRVLHRFKLDQRLVTHAVQRIHSYGYPALVLKDPVEAGYDYLVVTGEADHPLDPVTRWWFQSMNVQVRFARELSDDAHPEHTVRLGACGMSGQMAQVERDLIEAFKDELHLYHFPAVVAPEHASKAGDGQVLHVLEVFDRNANKWAAIEVLARQLGIDRTRIAAIGDQINDVAMLRGAALGIAMGNAVPAAISASTRQTKTNDDDGVAHAIGMMLNGEW